MPRILLIETADDVIKEVGRQIAVLGHELAGQCRDGETGVALAQSLKPDLVLVDLALTGTLSGVATAQTIREKLDRPVVFLTEIAGLENLQQARQCERFGYVIKPVDQRELGTVITVALYQHGAEAKLRRSLAEHEAILRTAMDGFGVIDLEGRILEVNDAYCRLSGYTREELLGMTVLDLDANVSLARVASAITALRESGSGRFERLHRTKGGQVIEVELSVNYLPGDPARIFCFIRDISARRHSDERLRLLSATLEAAANAIVITDREGIIQWANPAFTSLTGYTLGEVMGHSPRDLIRSGAQGDEYYREMWETILAGKVWSREITNRDKAGRLYQEEMTITPVRNPQGEITHFIAIKQDITEKKKLQEQFLRAQRLESLGMLASGIAHDLNNMLSPMIFAGPLLRENATSERDLRIIDTVEKSADRGASLVRQILAFAQGTTGILRITQLKHIARDVLAIVEATFPKNIRLEHDIAADASPVLANPTQIHQVLINLCVNARDAMPDGGTLTVKAVNRRLHKAQAETMPGARPGEWLVFEVTDTGTGIPADVLPHIWESFYTTKSPDKGTGLGLATVRGIVADHQGFITLDTVVGQGTTFRVFLPATHESESRAESRAPFAMPGGGHELIMVVDDDPAVRDIVSTILTNRGYRVLGCADGVEAIVNYNTKSQEIGLVITDVDMPNLSGTILAGTLRKLNPALKIIAMTGLSGTGIVSPDVQEIKTLTGDFLQKPFSPTTLLSAVNRALHGTARK